MQRLINWGKVAAGAATLALIGSLVIPFYANNNVDDLETDLNAKITALDEKLDAGISVEVLLDEGLLTTEIHEKLFEDDAWEAEAEVLVTEEYEKRDYKEIYKALSNIDDRDDVDYVTVKDIKFSGMDAEDKDGSVDILLKVKYEDGDGDKIKTYLHLEADIEEGEADITEITEVESDFEL